MDASVEDVSPHQQKQAMKELVKSLHIVLRHRNPALIGKLGDKMTTLCGPEMESIAEGMADVALAKTAMSAASSCPFYGAKQESS